VLQKHRYIFKRYLYKPLSVITLYSNQGLLAWKSSYIPFSSEAIRNFVKNDVSLLLSLEDVLIFDGAAVHLTNDVIESINTVTSGRYKKVPAYGYKGVSSPIEKEFSNVWTWALYPE